MDLNSIGRFLQGKFETGDNGLFYVPLSPGPRVVSETPPASLGRGSDGSTLGLRHRGPAVPAGSAADGLRGPAVPIRRDQ